MGEGGVGLNRTHGLSSPFVPSEVEGRWACATPTCLDFARHERVWGRMAFWTYILLCADGLYYTGHTDNLERRIAQHQHGGFCDFTSRRRPVTLVWSQYFGTRVEALEAERRIKPWSRAKKEALIRGDWEMVSHFAKPLTNARTSQCLLRNTPSPFVPSEVEGREAGANVSRLRSTRTGIGACPIRMRGQE